MRKIRFLFSLFSSKVILKNSNNYKRPAKSQLYRVYCTGEKNIIIINERMCTNREEKNVNEMNKKLIACSSNYRNGYPLHLYCY